MTAAVRTAHNDLAPVHKHHHMCGYCDRCDFRRDIDAAVFESASGVKKLLVVNKRSGINALRLPPETVHRGITTIDIIRPVAWPPEQLRDDMPPFAVTVVVAGR